MMMDSALKLHSRKQNNLGSGLDVIAAFIDSGLIECVLDNNGEKVWKKIEKSMKMSAIATKGIPIALRVASNNKIIPSVPMINS